MGECLCGLFQHGTLAGDDGLGDKQVICLYQTQIGRDTVAGRQAHKIAHNQSGRGQTDPLTIPTDCDLGVCQVREMVGDALGAQFLHKAHRAAEQQHTAYNDDRRGVAAEIGSQNDIGHQ